MGSTAVVPLLSMSSLKNTMIKKNFDRFAATTAALTEYDTATRERAALLERATTDAEISHAHYVEAQALRRVHEAFFADSANITTLEQCLRLDIAFLRRMSALGMKSKLVGTKLGRLIAQGC